VNEYLEHVDLSGNRISEEGVKALMEALDTNVRVRKLDLVSFVARKYIIRIPLTSYYKINNEGWLNPQLQNGVMERLERNQRIWEEQARSVRIQGNAKPRTEEL
jgi:hypothetical protein